jgi:hypothetical protein
VLPGTLTDEIADRWEILYDFDHNFYSTQRNRARKDVNWLAHCLNSQDFRNEKSISISNLDAYDISYILSDNAEFDLESYYLEIISSDKKEKVYDSTGVFYYLEKKEANIEGPQINEKKPILKYFYKSSANFFEIHKDNFDFIVNPILNLRYGNALDDPNIIFQNTRGIEMRGLIDNNIYFYTSLLENQRGFNNYINRRIDRDETIPGQGFFKPFQSGVLDNLNGYDYLNAQAYVGINATENVAIEFGHGNHFIGNGVRSLFLSNYGHNYFYLKFNTRIWKFHYQNLFAELAPIASAQNLGDKLLPKKYMANHYLSFKPTKDLELGLFEAVIFSRENTFEFQYLNPIILYRTVEQFLDSPDNVLIGLNGKWNIKNRYQLYSQLILDEFNLGMLKENNGWWANKYGLQIGAKAINFFGLDHLDVQVEYNIVRPYTYSHRDSLENFPNQSTASYSNHNQPLAHPLGSNFRELLFNISYRPSKRLYINSRIIATTFGQNPEGENFGSNILLISGSREMDFNNEMGQGINTKMLSLNLDISYQIAHNYFIDLNFLYRKSDADLDALDIETKYIGGGFRVNIGQLKLDY